MVFNYLAVHDKHAVKLGIARYGHQRIQGVSAEQLFTKFIYAACEFPFSL
jgi:hypothetical protein